MNKAQLRSHIDDIMEDAQRYASRKLSFQYQIVYFAGLIESVVSLAKVTTNISHDELEELKRELVKDYIK